MNRGGGYTLLEMVVVLAILGLATAMVAPATFRTIQSWRDADDVGRVLGDVAALPGMARNQGREIRLGTDPAPENTPPAKADPSTGTEADAPSPLTLPEGWRLSFDEPLVVRANGACNGTSGTLTTTRQTIRFRIDSPWCRVTRLPAGAS